jgi:hypothetical protein
MRRERLLRNAKKLLEEYRNLSSEPFIYDWAFRRAMSIVERDDESALFEYESLFIEIEKMNSLLRAQIKMLREYSLPI